MSPGVAAPPTPPTGSSWSSGSCSSCSQGATGASAPPPGGPQPAPKWMSAIDTLTPAKAAGLALILSAANPKNLALSLGAGASLAQAGVSGGEAVVGLALFVIIATLTIAVPVVLDRAGGEHAAHVLDGWRAWLSHHNTAVLAVLLLVFGAVLFSQGLRGLTA